MSAIKETFLILNICGINPNNQNIWSRIKIAATISMVTYVIVEELLQFAFNWRGWESVDEFTATTKAVFMMLKRRDLVVVLNKVEQFWSWDSLPIDVRQKLKRICENTTKSIKLFGISCAMCIVVYSLKPLFMFPLRTLPYDTYHPKDRNVSPNYEIMYIMHTSCGTIGCICLTGFDGLFISLVVHIICELKNLKQRFSAVKINPDVRGDERSCLDENNRLVDHHNFILGVVKDMDKLYSGFLLYQFSSSMICICSGLLSMITSGFPPDLTRFAKCLSFLLPASIQLLIYCIAGEFLIAESNSLADVVYESDWCVKNQPKLRNAYLMIIRRAQKAEELSAGGMFTLTLQSFTSIMRFAWSFFTMAQALYTSRDIN